jgi:hypothetical protein
MKESEAQELVANRIAELRELSYETFLTWVKEKRYEVTEVGENCQLSEQAFFDDQKDGPIRVLVDVHDPKKPGLLGFLPIFSPRAKDDFIIAPDGKFIGE